MKNILYILKRDIKRIFSNLTAVLVLLGICILPSFYAWINIIGYMDPYSNLSDVQVAVAISDHGTSNELTGDLNVGSLMKEALEENDTLSWQFVKENKALSGVRSGKYYGAFIVPEEFSEDFVSILSGKVKKPQINYYVNEKINTVAPKITDTGAETLQTEIDTAFRGAVANALMEVLQETSSNVIADIHSKSGSLENSINKARNVIAAYENSVSDLSESKKYRNDLITGSKGIAKQADSSISAIEGMINTDRNVIGLTLKDAYAAEKKIKNFHNEHPSALPEQTEKILADISKIETVLNSANSKLSDVNGFVYTLKPSVVQLADMLDNLNTGLSYGDKSIDGIQEALKSADKVLEDAQKSIEILKSSKNLNLLRNIDTADDSKFSEVVSSPVILKTESLYPVKNYGSGMTPFFTMLAIWVGGLMLIAIVKLEVDKDGEEERKITMKQAYFARGILFTVIGLVQAVIVCLGDLVIGVQCLHPAAFIFAGMVASIVFTNLIYALAVAFRHIGKAIAVILVIFQIPGSSGTFPIELTGAFFSHIYPLLPFSYGISATRESIAGYYQNTYWTSLATLLIFLAIALFIGIYLRPRLAAVNHTFDTRLGDTGIFLNDTGLEEKESIAIKKAIKLINSRNESKAILDKKVSSFEQRYNRLLKHGLIYVFGTFAALLILLFILPVKPIFICLWIMCIITLVMALFLAEHAHLAILERTNTSGGHDR